MAVSCLDCKHYWGDNPTNDLRGYWCGCDLPEGEEPWFGNMNFLGNQEFEFADKGVCTEFSPSHQPTKEEIEAERAELFRANGLGHLVVGA